MARFGGDLDPAGMLFNDAIHGGEPQTGSLPRLLGGKKRFEYVGQMLGRNATAVILYPEPEKLPNSSLGVGCRMLRIHCDRCRPDSQPPAIDHGITGVDRQIHQDLLDHARVGLDVRGSAVDIRISG